MSKTKTHFPTHQAFIFVRQTFTIFSIVYTFESVAQKAFLFAKCLLYFYIERIASHISPKSQTKTQSSFRKQKQKIIFLSSFNHFINVGFISPNKTLNSGVNAPTGFISSFALKAASSGGEASFWDCEYNRRIFLQKYLQRTGFVCTICSRLKRTAAFKRALRNVQRHISS